MNRKPFATVLVPTHNHAHLIGYAIRSIQDQSFSDFELFVVGDGASAETRDVVGDLARSDPRIRYFDFPKGQRHGEAHRHVALQEARGEIVAYCGDDDLWLRGHLASLAKLLKRHDFGHMVQINVHGRNEFVVYGGSFAEPGCWQKVRDGEKAFFGLTVGGHRMSAYRALPVGWSPAPAGTYTDQFMWRKFLRQPGLRFASGLEATSIHIASPARTDWTAQERVAELKDLFERRDSAELRVALERAIRTAHHGWTPPDDPLLVRLVGQAKLLGAHVENLVGRWRRPS
ncbi:glycosyl transferase [Aminobacter sp. Y103A]|uniref:glycosyltransferase family 2 protein n=1 Tax=Aminobacter sp. Y103A TaxID=1870862 RepID=UPI002572FFC2|nr:glycosyltransferase family A protein [Aminobacter sp. SS-2016]BBD35376.1 glycosyl transferase [Aminobacter sp. SS-2016]